MEGMINDGIRPLAVLIVDDVAMMRELLRDLLSFSDRFRVVGESGDGIQALAACDALKPDLILMDVEMPRMDGLAATAILHARHPATKVVIVSASERPAVRVEAERAGAVAFIPKTELSIGRLLACVMGDAERVEA